ncbi:MAG: hypothetical protein ACFFG0_34260 [Candidatus Thorarchaeota archaeon]
MTKEEERQNILDYKEKVREQYKIAEKTGSEYEANKANKMYGRLIYFGNKYQQDYGEPIDVFLS